MHQHIQQHQVTSTLSLEEKRKEFNIKKKNVKSKPEIINTTGAVNH